MTGALYLNYAFRQAVRGLSVCADLELSKKRITHITLNYCFTCPTFRYT